MTDWQKKRDEEAEELRVEADIGIRYPEAYLNGFKAGADWATRELLKHGAVVGLVKTLEIFDAIHFTESGQSCAFGSDKAYEALAAFEKFEKEIGE